MVCITVQRPNESINNVVKVQTPWYRTLISSQSALVCTFTAGPKLDSMRRFSQSRSRTPLFGGAHPGGLWLPNKNSSEIFIQCTYPKFRHPMFTRSEVIVLTNTHTHTHTHRQTPLKTPTLFATLRRWVINLRVWLYANVKHQTEAKRHRHFSAAAEKSGVQDQSA